jgi:predicted nucleic acid-binding protein
MGVEQSWLIDKSALWRLGTSPDAALWASRIDRGLVRISTVTLLELGFSATSATEWNEGLHDPPVGNMVLENLTPGMEARAVQVQGLLATRGHHRAAGVADLLLTATAELASVTLLHVDKDFELIASVTGQAVERLTTA